jgi:hypothetical protein
VLVARAVLAVVLALLALPAAQTTAGTGKAGEPFLPPPLPGLRELSALAAHEHALVQVDLARSREAAPFLEQGGGELVSERLAVWRVPGRAAPRLALELAARGLLRAAEPDVRRAFRSHLDAADPLVPAQWWLAAVGADQVEPPGPGIPVVLLDSGLDVTHSEFAGRPDLELLNAQDVTAEGDDHGTAVASVAAAPANGVGLVGVYPQARLQVWDTGSLSTSEIVAGLELAADRAPGVVNMSFGSAEPSFVEEEAVLVAFGAGSVLVAAAGNEFQEGNPTEYPASYNHVLTVAATDQAGSPTAFSNANLAVDLAAPGQAIPVAVPAALDPSGFSVYDGTSFAAPIVSGAAAWVWTARPELDNTQVFDLVRFSARDLGPPGYDVDTGFGLLDIPAALAREAPGSDLQEPNDDIYQVKANGLFSQATRPLTRPGRGTAAIDARLDVTEDPEDVYRVWIPAKRTVTMRVRGDADVDVDVWRPETPTVFVKGKKRKRFLITWGHSPGRRAEKLVVTNTGTAGVFVYLDVYLPAGGPYSAGYTVEVATAKARRA